ncbi:ShlB/FhaC/HecB family hemolysin secretion/activation protein [Roseateles paludis]|uniref:ShlB/FhaC/HecB family hemolysin secretion/activation protein n=1 Tax=Roseateles paludis TaxID=3145238 RepID=A0ABV0G2C1_9BURK
MNSLPSFSERHQLRLTLMALLSLSLNAPTLAQTAPPPLRRLIVADASHAMPANHEGLGLQWQGLPELDRPALRSLLSTALGQPLTPATVQALVTALNSELAATRERFSVASVPDQDVSQGQLRIVVTRGRLAALRISGAADADAISRQFDAVRGDAAIDAAALDTTLAWIDRALPGRNSEARFSPGAQPGAVALDLQVKEPDRLTLSAGADNTGSPVTGTRRVSAGLTINRLLGSNDQAGLRISGDPSFGHSRSWQASYQVGLPWRHVLSLNANGGSIHGRMPEPLDLRGSSSGQSLRYEIPLRLTGPWTDSLTLGFDHKRSDNNLLFSDTPVTQTVTDIGQFNASYGAERPDALGRTRITATLTVSPGGLFGHNDDDAFSATRAGAQARYQVVQLQLERGTPLGALHWQSQLTLQQASTNLLGSEQLNGGGMSSVRGFAEGAGYGDSGWLWRNELRAPSSAGPAGLVLTPSLLLDAAQLRVHSAQPGEPARRHLASAGLGLTASGPGKLSLSLQWAQRIKSGVPSQAQHGSRLHVSLQWAGL